MYVYGTEANLLRRPTRPDMKFGEIVNMASSIDQYTRLELFEKRKDQPKEIPLVAGDPILEQIDEFADCILTGRKRETDGPAALKALAFIGAAIESARTGEPVQVKI
jgi:predicted dehydrogenase